MSKKHVIWSNINIDEINWRDDYREFCASNEIDYNENDLDEWIHETLIDYYDNEFNNNLDYKLSNKILVIAKLDLWDEVYQGYKILGSNLSDVGMVVVDNIDYAEFYTEDGELCATGIHHDGTNKYLFRVVKTSLSKDDIFPLLMKIVNNENYKDLLEQYTDPLGKTVNDIYGWENDERKEEI